MKTNKKLSLNEEIISLEADINYTTILFKDGSTFYSSYTLGFFEKKYINNPNFLRINRSIIINTHFLNEINDDNGKTYAQLLNGTRYKIARRRRIVISEIKGF
ncbi:LytTR family transcriptional regulator [Lacihabitans sp. LS3-19]|uniref:LytTR family DNA-binding domain-containing protein n=1 Tax=Lacihabitans sp. LS3-19 TaxID=2487335 RepID=UPI0020CC7F49|nr:LytTR family DNA-binding domain-containing protein [Lacihabitans sp. LS3-19]MCP9770921.1 LytTR family transcriptional regulator [Lacihabitans sp. LS3-19]